MAQQSTSSSSRRRPPQHRLSEAEAVEEAYHWAIQYVAAQTVQDTMSMWQAAAAYRVATPSAERWVEMMQRTLKLRRGWLVQLTEAYYRLIRALLTGRTVSMPSARSGTPTVESLRQEFETVVHEIARHAGTTPKPVGVTVNVVSKPLPADLKPLPVDELDADVEKLIGEAEAEAEKQIAANMEALGPQRYEAKTRVIDTSKPAEKVDAKRQEEFATSGRRVSAAAARITMDAARKGLFDMSQADMKVMGWIRYSSTGTPCAWCAMLLSRGFTKRSGLYRSQKTAITRTDKKTEEVCQFHDNCNCRAVPIFDKSQLEWDVFELNARYAKEWIEVTKGKRDQMVAWREHIKVQQASLKESGVQEAS